MDNNINITAEHLKKAGRAMYEARLEEVRGATQVMAKITLAVAVTSVTSNQYNQCRSMSNC